MGLGLKKRKLTPAVFKRAMAVFGLMFAFMTAAMVFLPWEKPWTSSSGISAPISGWELATEQGWISPYIVLAGVIVALIGTIGVLVSPMSHAGTVLNVVMIVGGALILAGGILGYLSVPQQANILPGVGVSSAQMGGGGLMIFGGLALVGGLKPERMGLKTGKET